MQTTNSDLRTSAMLKSAMLTLIPMLLAAGAVFFHFQLTNKEQEVRRGELASIKKRYERDTAIQYLMLVNMAKLDSMFHSLEQSEKQYHDVLGTGAPDESTLLGAIEKSEIEIKKLLETIQRQAAGSDKAGFYASVFELYRTKLNAKKDLRKSWESKVPPSNCPEFEEKLNEAETRAKDWEAKYFQLLIQKAGSGGGSDNGSALLRQMQLEKTSLENKNAQTEREAQQWQKAYNDLSTNIKEIVGGFEPNGGRKKRLSNCEGQLKMIETVVRSSNSKSASQAKYKGG